MKKIKFNKTMMIQTGFVWTIACLSVLCGCNDFLDQEPLSQISPEKYFADESQLASYANGLYAPILPSGMIVDVDRYSDNHAAFNFSLQYVPGELKLNQTGGEWSFGNIYDCNYFLANVLPKYEAGTLAGSADNIRHYIGEVYLLRAFEYFKKLQALGDFPIVTEPLPDDLAILTEASKRAPRNEVARFILSDLDKAIEMLATNFGERKTRINKESALLVKSRVALYEGSFLKYFNGTAFVPNGPNWPGASKDYNSGYQYPSGSIDNEINFFLDQAIDAAQQLANTVVLANNTGMLQQDPDEAANPFMNMFSDDDLSGYGEILLWREYNRSLGLVHSMWEWGIRANHGNGTTRGFIESYLMANGLPIYAEGSGYHGDDFIADVRKDRDNRLFLWLKEPGQRNFLWGQEDLTRIYEVYPNITGSLGVSSEAFSTTGYAVRKGLPLNSIHAVTGGYNSYSGIVVFRGVEALLNYIEAYYERYGSLNPTALAYWQAIRARAKVDTDVNKTIAATVMAKEAPNDWGAYSAGQLIDATLYNIRRERRSEFMVEGLRWMDLQRWRALDQMINTPYHIEGFKVWGPMQEWYLNEDGSSQLLYGLDSPQAIVSPPDRSEYLRPYERLRGSLVLDGYRWAMAHYLSPISLQHFLITSIDNDVSTSPIYQNPGWTMVVGEGAQY